MSNLREIIQKTAIYIEAQEKTLSYIKKVADATGRSCKDLCNIWRDAAAIAKEEGKAGDFEHTQGLFKSMAGINDNISEEMLIISENLYSYTNKLTNKAGRLTNQIIKFILKSKNTNWKITDASVTSTKGSTFTLVGIEILIPKIGIKIICCTSDLNTRSSAWFTPNQNSITIPLLDSTYVPPLISFSDKLEFSREEFNKHGINLALKTIKNRIGYHKYIKDVLKHELIHFLDYKDHPQRLKGKINFPKPKEYSFKNYYNQSTEILAFISEILKKMTIDKSTTTLNKFINKVLTISNKNNPNFLKNLSRDNYNKILRLIQNKYNSQQKSIIKKSVQEDEGTSVSAEDVSEQTPENMVGKPVQPNKPDENNEQGINSLKKKENITEAKLQPQTLKIFDNEKLDLPTILTAFKQGKFLAHARIKDETDFKYGIKPSSGKFLSSTDSFQTSIDEFGEGPKLIFFSDNTSPIDTWANFFLKKRKPVELVFVEKNKTIQKSLGNGKVLLSTGEIVSYEKSPNADYESQVYQNEPAGVETGDWYTRFSQDVVATIDVKI